jgi:hypothetical protein
MIEGGASDGLPGSGGTGLTGGVLGRGGTSNGGAPSQGGRAAAGGTLGAGGSLAGSAGISVASGGKGGASNPPSEITQRISKTADDCTWIQHGGEYEERLRYSDAETWLEAGSDSEQGRVGLRFTLPIPAKATIVAATLQLQRLGGSAAATETLTIQVYDTGNVPVFDPSHRHGPGGHATLFTTAIRGTLVGEAGKNVTSADLRTLVQRVVDRPDFAQGDVVGTIGFVLSLDTTDGWASYGDSSTGSGASLRVSYRPL